MPAPAAPAAQDPPGGQEGNDDGRTETNIPNFKVSAEAAKQVLNDKLPKRHKVAPTFDASQPWLLTKYFDELEEIFKYSGVTEDDAKILLALNYMEWNTKKVHEGLAELCVGDWGKFKEELIQAYPESVDHGKGSVKCLKEIVNDHRIIPLNQHKRFLKYVCVAKRRQQEGKRRRDEYERP